MSLYNAVFGFNPACVLLLPMIGKTREDFPRFRDCFLGDTDRRTIQVFTRTGGGNRDGYAEENDAVTKFEGYLSDWDDDFDSTFAYWEFAVPEKWHADFDRVVAGDCAAMSEDCKALIKSAYPRLADQIDKLTTPKKEGSGS